MPATFLEQIDLAAIAARVGTPFYVYSADVLRQRIADLRASRPVGWCSCATR
jgi:diaminopimelate decarboxylase